MSQNKKYFLFLVLPALFMILILLLLKRSPFGKSNSSFSIDPEAKVTRVELSGKEGSLILESDGNRWLVNGKSEARKGGINMLLALLREIKIKSPVSPALFEEEIGTKNIEPVKVKVYSKTKLIKKFMVYKTRSNVYGNIMKTGERSKPFVVYVPGQEENIGSFFTLNELYWKPYTVFNLLPSEIESVKLENIADNSSSFQIENNPGSFKLNDNAGHLQNWDNKLIERYLSYFTWIPFESWALDLTSEEQKKIEDTSPLYRIIVKTRSGKEISLTLWERSVMNNNKMEKDTDRLYAKTKENTNLFIMRYFDIDPVLKKSSYFFPDNKSLNE